MTPENLKRYHSVDPVGSAGCFQNLVCTSPELSKESYLLNGACTDSAWTQGLVPITLNTTTAIKLLAHLP